LKEGLEKLYSLQLLDDKLRELDNSLKEIPEAIKKLEQERDGKANIVETTRKKLIDNLKEREKIEKEILLVKEKIKKYKEQMGKATTNKEYQGFMAEIKFEEDAIAGLEEKVIEKMVESDEILAEIRQSETEYKQISEEYNKKIADMNGMIDYNKQKLEEVKKDKSAARTMISRRLLDMYDNISSKKYGKAVSLVESEFCGICNVKIRPQRMNELLTPQSIATCESCGRILFRKIEVKKEAPSPNERN